MKNLKKKNNKGFSLVELIVVVMIMAILAVALAPQVMKWVGNSKQSADVSTYESLYSTVTLALTKDTVYSAIIADAEITTVTISDTATAGGDFIVITSATAGKITALDGELQKLLGTDYKAKMKNKVKAASGAKTYTIVVSGDGTVKKDVTPDATLK